MKFKNTKPGELSIAPSKCYVAAGGTVRLVGHATDEDGDSLTYYWSAPSGSFVNVTPNGSAVDWTSTSTPSAVTITMTVSDEIATATRKQVITACELLPATILVSRAITNQGHFYITRPDGPLRIPGNVDVTIEPGVTIVIDRPSGGMEVYGRLVAVGTSGQRITIKGNTCGTESGLWSGIYLRDVDGRGTMRFCDITSGMDGVTARDGAVATLSDCQIYNQLDFGVSSMNGSSVLVERCSVWENGDGIFVDNSHAAIRRASVRYNDGDGIVCNRSEADTSIITIDSCVVANNVTDGIEIGGLADPAIHYCSIFSNNEGNGGNYAIRLSACTTPGPVHAENNYWGLNNNTESAIAAIILDANDPYTGNTAVVSFTPWLAEAVVARWAQGDAGGPWAR